MSNADRWWNERIRKWADECEIATDSVPDYIEKLTTWARSIEALGFPRPTNASAISREMVLAYKERGVCVRGRKAGTLLAHATRAKTLCLLKEFLAFERSPLALNAKLFRMRHAEPENVGYLDNVTDVDLLVNACADSPEVQAAIVLGAFANLRPGEIRDVTVADLRLSLTGQSRVHVRDGKWGKPRTVSIPTAARNVLANVAVGKGLTERLYPWGRTMLGRQLDRAGQAAGLGHVRPMDLRRSYSRFARRAGAKIEGVQAQMGHVRPETTLRYIRQDPEARDEVAVLLDRYIVEARAR